MEIKRIISQLLESNVYVVAKDESVLIIDCGCSVEMIEEFVKGKKVEGVLLTHGHYDHSKYCNEFAEKFNCKIYASNKVKNTLTDEIAIYSEEKKTINNLSNFIFLEDDGQLKLGEFKVDYFYCPGHSECCECYLIEENLFAGDVLFERSVGRTDLKGSNKNMMIETLSKLEKLNFEKVFSGHGESTDREEQMKNIKVYKKFLSR